MKTLEFISGVIVSIWAWPQATVVWVNMIIGIKKRIPSNIFAPQWPMPVVAAIGATRHIYLTSAWLNNVLDIHFDGLHWTSPFIFLLHLLIWWIVRNWGRDYRKKWKEKALSTVVSLGHRLVVKPSFGTASG
jgi:hypothetical protein